MGLEIAIVKGTRKFPNVTPSEVKVQRIGRERILALLSDRLSKLDYFTTMATNKTRVCSESITLSGWEEEEGGSA